VRKTFGPKVEDGKTKHEFYAQYDLSVLLAASERRKKKFVLIL
jgi:hypothetical protein